VSPPEAAAALQALRRRQAHSQMRVLAQGIEFARELRFQIRNDHRRRPHHATVLAARSPSR
jgi:hypothetical protein